MAYANSVGRYNAHVAANWNAGFYRATVYCYYFLTEVFRAERNLYRVIIFSGKIKVDLVEEAIMALDRMVGDPEFSNLIKFFVDGNIG